MLNYAKPKNVTAALQIAAVTTILGLCSAMQAQAQEDVKTSIKQEVSNISGVDSIGGDQVLKLFKQLDDQRTKLVKISLLYSKYAMENQ